MNCEICGNEVPVKNSVVCPGKCSALRKRLFELEDKYYPTNGCDNCWGDEHIGCTEQCKKEFRESSAFGQDLWSIIRIIYPK